VNKIEGLQMKSVEESIITRAIIRKAAEDWINLAKTDAIVVGAGPSGLTAAMYLAKTGLETVVFERKLSFGGGIGGGGMQFHKLVVQDPADKILKETGCELELLEKDVYVADTAAMIAHLASATIDAGAKIIFGVIVDDLIYRDSRPVDIGHQV
jgi:thiamine thiazole synthase